MEYGLLGLGLILGFFSAFLSIENCILVQLVIIIIAILRYIKNIDHSGTSSNLSRFFLLIFVCAGIFIGDAIHYLFHFFNWI